jgi:endonuclease/exonuclease/phosphatase family metal-dependent hydrolase
MGLGSPNGFVDHLLDYFRSMRTRRDQLNLPKISQFIQTQNPDIVGLQEVDAGSHRNGKFSHLDVLPYRYKRFSQERNGYGYLNDGNLLLAQHPFTSQSHTLSHELEKRTCIAAVTRIDGQDILIISTHLATWPFNWYVRKKQYAQIVRILNDHDLPTIVMGDFNCTPYSTEFAEFLSKTGLTLAHNVPTFPTHTPRWCFDNIAVSNHFKITSARILHVPLSDHLPVIADIEFI